MYRERRSEKRCLAAMTELQGHCYKKKKDERFPVSRGPRTCFRSSTSPREQQKSQQYR